jgi:hypothetical protein
MRGDPATTFLGCVPHRKKGWVSLRGDLKVIFGASMVNASWRRGVSVSMDDPPIARFAPEDRRDSKREGLRGPPTRAGDGPLDGCHISEIATDAGAEHLVCARLAIGDALRESIDYGLDLSQPLAEVSAPNKVTGFWETTAPCADRRRRSARR